MDSHPVNCQALIILISNILIFQLLDATSAVGRVTLPGDMESGWKEEASVCGWGATAEGGQGSDVLMSAAVPIKTDEGEERRRRGIEPRGCGFKFE